MIDDDDTAASTVAATATTNKSINNSSNCNKNNNNVIITKIIITIKMKNGYALKKKLKVAICMVRFIFNSVKKKLLNCVFVSVKAICCF